MTELRCPYCFKKLGSENFTDEHVIPAALGGNITPNNPFKLRVCAPCNRTCGKYVDGPFIRSPFVHNSRALHAENYYAFDDASAPRKLVYIGKLNELRWNNQVCELWKGPTGDAVYYFRPPFDHAEDELYVGPRIDPRKRSDGAFVVLVVQATNRVWHPRILEAIRRQFGDLEIFQGNFGTTPPPAVQPLVARIRELNGAAHECELVLDHDMGSRFLAKVVLGLGALLLGDDFVASRGAQNWRELLWAKTREERVGLPVYGSGFLDGGSVASRNPFAVWPAGHVLTMLPISGLLALRIVFYGQHAATVRVSDEPYLWKDVVGHDGLVHLIAPHSQSHSGPHSLRTYAATLHHPDTPRCAELARFLAEQSRVFEQPPFHLPGDAGIMTKGSQHYLVVFGGSGEREDIGPFESEDEVRRAIQVRGLRIVGSNVSGS